MKDSVYKAARLNIFEKHRNNLITESQRDELFAMLEKEKCDSELSDDKVLDILDEMEDMYPDLEDDIKDLADKIKDASKDSKDSKDDEDEESDEGEDGEVSEAFHDLMNEINNL